jgi:uncharacterized membrane protein
VTKSSEKTRNPLKAAGRYILIGLLTALPLIITWLIVSFLFSQLSYVGEPFVRGLARGIRPQYPDLAKLMVNETLLSVVAALIVLGFLLFLGWGAGRVVGQRLIGSLERLISAIPFVDRIYRASKQVLAVAAGNSNGERRVVLVDFPSPGMKAVGLLTRTMRDSVTGEKLAVVYVPKAPNPTSGYIEIVPIQSVIFTDWTFDQAMSFVVTGGSTSPDQVKYRHGAKDELPEGQ